MPQAVVLDQAPQPNALIRCLTVGGHAMLAAACITAADPVTGESTQIESVQPAATAACRSWPSAEIVAEILASGDPRLDTTSAIAGAICAAISRPAGVQTVFSAPPTVNDVAIRGERLPDGGGT